MALILSQLRYKAFISYSHQDASWGRWLQRVLEGYRVPRRLVGKEGEFGAIPPRLTPVFRDREDLSSAADLSGSIKQELTQAETLIVICSPSSAQSRWVNEEIRYFQSLGRGDRIYALITDGEPASGDPSNNCFPPALVVNEDGSEREPLAADLRKWGDGRLLAKLKLISGILGIRLDELRRRDMQRRHRLWMASSVLTLAVAVVTTVLAIVAVNARNAAENRREHAEDLVGYMVGDLREKLATVGRLDILDSMGGEVTQYLDTLDSNELTDESLNQQAKVWRQLGEVSKDQGKLNEAMDAFTKSRNILAELYRRQPGNSDRLFELGQAEFWVGYISSDLGDLTGMERGLTSYLNISNELLELEPGSADWTMEVSYALGNMGWLEKSRHGSDPEKILQYMESSLDYNRRAVMLAPDNMDFRVALTDSHADLADAYLQVCNLGQALLNRQRNVELATGFYENNPGDSNLKENLAYAKSGWGSVQRSVGMVVQSLENYRESESLLDELSRNDPSDLHFLRQKVLRTQQIAIVYSHTDEQQTAKTMMTKIASELNVMNQSTDSLGIEDAIDYADFLEAYAELAYLLGDELLSNVLLQEGMEHVINLVNENPDHAMSRYQLVLMIFQYWQQNNSLPDGEVLDLLDGYLSNPEKIDSCSDTVAAAKLSLMNGDKASAREYSSYLFEKGYFEPGFVHFCRMHDLCER